MKKMLAFLFLLITLTVGSAGPTFSAPKKIIIAEGTSGEISVDVSTLRTMDYPTTPYPVKFGQLTIQMVGYDYDTGSPVKTINTNKFAFATVCVVGYSGFYEPSILLLSDVNSFDPFQHARGQDLWLVLALQKVSEAVCHPKYKSVKIISVEETKKLIPVYFESFMTIGAK